MKQPPMFSTIGGSPPRLFAAHVVVHGSGGLDDDLRVLFPNSHSSCRFAAEPGEHVGLTGDHPEDDQEHDVDHGDSES